MSLHIAPPRSHPTTHSHIQSSLSAPSAPGLHDTLRAGIGSEASTTLRSSSDANKPIQTSSTHPLEVRLAAWQSTQENLKMESLRRTFGMSEPIRRGMELKITREGSWKPACLPGGGSNLHEDILLGRDEACEWEDVFVGEGNLVAANGGQGIGMHDEVERKVRMMQ